MKTPVLPTIALIAAAVVQTGGAAQAQTPVNDTAHKSRIAAHFDITKGQQPENVATTASGTSYVTFAGARQVAKISKNRTVRILVTLPAPPDGGTSTPALGFALTTGIVRSPDGTLYFLYASGDEASTGLYKLRPTGKKPHLISRLPANGLPNGLVLDTHAKRFYVTDSVLGKIYTINLQGGSARVWSNHKALKATGFLGANGIKVRRGALWVSNLDQGTLLRIPIRKGHAAVPRVKAKGLVGIDDFEFTGHRDQVIAALNPSNKVVRITSNGHATTFLTAKDGLQGPTSVGIRHHRAYVYSAAYLTQTDPNLIIARLPSTR